MGAESINSEDLSDVVSKAIDQDAAFVTPMLLICHMFILKNRIMTKCPREKKGTHEERYRRVLYITVLCFYQ